MKATMLLPMYLTDDYEATQRDQRQAAYREMINPCYCGEPGTYCPAHGEYTPATEDLEIEVAVLEASRSPRVATRVVRKPLER